MYQENQNFCEGLSEKPIGEAWRLIRKFSNAINRNAIESPSSSCAREVLKFLTGQPLTYVATPNLKYNIRSNKISNDEARYHIESKIEKSAPGIDGISYEIFKHLPSQAIIKLTKIFNQLLITPRIDISVKSRGSSVNPSYHYLNSLPKFWSPSSTTPRKL
ncbi:hypothetical protein WA026_001143 [Henosepilachna vigintioctopunctata]|uniref:Uncharacterized protein n=1 Tax=Henosepilachna vigintioctopunctata TaxID=420089 RepID=A0AAW1V1G9_9CUCU